MIRRRLRIVAAVAVAAAAGCSYGGEGETESGASDTSASFQRTDTTPPSVSAVTPAAKEAISDWYEDGVFDRDHSCGAIETALAAIPVSLERYEDVVAAFRDYRTSVC